MILDIDHIALNSSDFSTLADIFCKLDYVVEFDEKRVKNPKIKENLMQHFSEYHDLCLLKSKDNLNIELLNHKIINKKNGFLTPIFDGVNRNFPEKNQILKIKNSNIPLIIEYTDNNFLFNKIIIETNNLEESENFWKSLGFFQKKDSENHLCFNSILSEKKYELILKENEDDSKNNLDDAGWNCIALLSNSIEKEYDFLKNRYITTKIELLEINQKQLRIFFVKSPGGELIEIISLMNQ